MDLTIANAFSPNQPTDTVFAQNPTELAPPQLKHDPLSGQLRAFDHAGGLHSLTKGSRRVQASGMMNTGRRSNFKAQASASTTHRPLERSWSPYEMNGGSVVALAGDDFAIIAADTRLCRDYDILSRNVPKLCPLTSKTVVGTGGCYTDVATLQKLLKANSQVYSNTHGIEMSTEGAAQMLSNTLYGRRFFPYYAFNIVAGIDKEGKGALYGYDAVGSYQRDPDNATSVGSATQLIVPVLDNIRGTGQGVGTNRTDKTSKLTLEGAKNLIKDCFITAGERDIHTGDAVEIMSITKNGITREIFELKKD